MAAVEIAEHTTRWRLCKVEGDGRAEQRKRLVLSEINDDEVETQEYVQMRMHGRESSEAVGASMIIPRISFDRLIERYQERT